LLGCTEANQPALDSHLWLAIPANNWEVVKIVNATHTSNYMQLETHYGSSHIWQCIQFHTLTYLKFAHLVTLFVLPLSMW
jgi:hypothetical protein